MNSQMNQMNSRMSNSYNPAPSNINLSSRKRFRTEEPENGYGNNTERQRLEGREPKRQSITNTSVETALRQAVATQRNMGNMGNVGNVGNVGNMGNAGNRNSNNFSNNSDTAYSDVNNVLKNRAESIGDAIEAVRMVENRQNANSALAYAAAETARISEIQAAMNTIRRSSAGNSIGPNSMASAAEAVRLAEMENQLDSLGTRSFGERRNSNSVPFDVLNALTSLSQQSPHTSTSDLLRLLEVKRRNSTSSAGLTPESSSQFGRKRMSFTTASEAIQKMELEAAKNSFRNQGTSVGSLSAADLSGILEPAYKDEGNISAMRRRSSYGKDSALMENVLSALRRRSSAGNSMATAAEAVRLAEVDVAMNSLRHRRNSGHMRNSGHSNLGNSSMAAAAEIVRQAEAMKSLRRSSNGTAGSMATAAEIVRMSELDNTLNIPSHFNNNTLNIPSQYNRNTGRNRFNNYEDMMRDNDDSMNPMMMRGNGGNNSIAAAAAEVRRLADLESSSGTNFLGNNLFPPSQGREPQQRGQSRRRVSFHLDNSFHPLNGCNTMNGYQP